MKLKRILLGMLAAASVISVPASAGVLGMADLAVLSLGIVTPTGVPIIGGISILSDQRTGSAASNYNGADGIGVGVGSASGNAPGATVDVRYRCAGDCTGLPYAGVQAVGTTAPLPENDLSTHIKTATKNFALGDMTIAGSAVSGPGANGLTRADSSVVGSTNIGGASGAINNTVRASSSTSFILLPPNGTTTTLDARFALTYDVFRKVWIDPLMSATDTGIASAGTTFTLTLSTAGDPGFTLNWTPGALNASMGAFTSADNDEFEQTNTIFSDVRTLVAGRTYNLTITQASLSSASQVPEPGSIVLIGLGLAALGSVARRRRA